LIRVLHTADWHIGQTMRGYSREFEHRAVFGRLVEIVAEREVDALIVAGDVFDGQNPSGESHQLFYETLVRLHRARPKMTIVIVAGNHDAAGRLEAPRALLRSFNVHVVGNIRRRDGVIEADRHLIPLPDPTGNAAAHVMAVSYPTAACLPALVRLDGEGESPVVRAVRSLYSQLRDTLAPRFSGLPLIATGHLHVMGGIESEGAERRILIGGQHAVSPEIFPEEFDYVALGHLHKAQRVGRDTIRYSGSLIPLSATELSYRHGVTLVTMDGTSVTSEHILLERPVPFLRLAGAEDVRLSEVGDHLEAMALPPDLPFELRPFLQIRLAREGITSGFREEVDRLAEAFPVRIVDVRVAAVADIATNDEAPDELVRLTERDPEDLFRMAFAKEFGQAPDAAHLDVFHRVRSEA